MVCVLHQLRSSFGGGVIGGLWNCGHGTQQHSFMMLLGDKSSAFSKYVAHFSACAAKIVPWQNLKSFDNMLIALTDS